MATALHDVLPDDRVLEPAQRDRLAVRALRAALLLALAGDVLLRGGGLGLNALLLALLLAGAAWSLDRQRGDGATRARLPLLVPIAAAGVALFWRDAEPLALGAVGSALLALALHAAWLRAGPAWDPGRLDVAAPVLAVLHLARDGLTQGGLLVVRDVPHAAAGVAGATPRWRSIAGGWRGALVALPLLVVFNALLASADPIWERQVSRLVRVDLEEVIGHVLAVTALAWLAAGWLRGALLAPPARAAAAAAPRLTVGAADVILPMMLVNVLFGGFVLLQLRALAGGAAYVQAASGLTFAEYARRGFFELVVVAALALPALLAADALAPLDHRARRLVRRGAGVTLVLLGGILAAAAARMALYLDAYGLTEDRLYASVVMAWLAGVLAWFAATVLRGRRERFASGALAGAWLAWAALVVANPEAIVVRANVARLAAARSFDASYVARLGPDAAPALVAALPRLGVEDRCVLRRAMAHDAWRRQRQARDWRAWSLAGWRAERAWSRAGIVPVEPHRSPSDACGIGAPVAAGTAAPGGAASHAAAR